MIGFILFISFVILQRLIELVVARRNERWARSQGAVEYGQAHYPYIVALHTLFIVAMIAEYWWKGGQFSLFVLTLFLMLIAVKIWALSSLGKYWNTKILRIPGSVFVRKGPYRWFKHPNYFIVVCEIIAIPMVYHLVYTVIVFTLLNALMLSVRIREENKVWAS